MKTIVVATEAARQWKGLDRTVRSRIHKKLVRYAETGAGDVKTLTGRPGACLRVGDWRVIFVEDARTVTVMAVGHRGQIYD